MKLATIFCLTILALPFFCGAQTGIAITNARIVTAEGATIEHGNILIEGDHITAVGVNMSVPTGFQIIDGKSLTVYPGLIDAFCLAGVAAPPSSTPPPVQRGAPFGNGPRGQRAGGQVVVPAQLSWRKATEGQNTKSKALPALRNEGFSTLLLGSRGTLTPGEDVLVNFQTDIEKPLVVNDHAAINLNMLSRGFSTYPSTLMAAFAFLRQALYDAVDYRNRPNDKSNVRLEGLARATSAEVPTFITANSVNDIKRTMRLAKEFHLRLVILGGRESEKVSAQLLDEKIVVALDGDWATAGALAKLGVSFVLVSNKIEMDDSDAKSLRANAIALAEKGVPTDTLIAALTRIPAEILGVSNRLGSIKAGKIANLVITDGDIFKKETKVKFTILNGKRIEPTVLSASNEPKLKPLPEDGGSFRTITYDDADGDGGNF